MLKTPQFTGRDGREFLFGGVILENMEHIIVRSTLSVLLTKNASTFVLPTLQQLLLKQSFYNNTLKDKNMAHIILQTSLGSTFAFVNIRLWKSCCDMHGTDLIISTMSTRRQKGTKHLTIPFFHYGYNQELRNKQRVINKHVSELVLIGYCSFLQCITIFGVCRMLTLPVSNLI